MFTTVQGLITAMFKVPAGYTFDGNVQLTTPLTAQTFRPVTTTHIGQTVILTFDRSLLDNNIPLATRSRSPCQRTSSMAACRRSSRPPRRCGS